ncbi:MAG: hypothetical protein FJX99_08460 [Bacteroidetes bacterium]|nr:hypothetical protein [Bacteroidota bacterium]
MKATILSILFIWASNKINAQTNLTPYAGNWKMTPSNPSHVFSSINVVNNGSTVTIKLKKSPLKTFTGRINPGTNRLETYMNQIGYYFQLGSGNLMSVYQIEGNIKIGDYNK